MDVRCGLPSLTHTSWMRIANSNKSLRIANSNKGPAACGYGQCNFRDGGLGHVRRGGTPSTHAPAIPYCVGTRNIWPVMEVPSKTLSLTLGVNARCARHRDSSGQPLRTQTLPVAPTLQWYSPKNSYSFSQAVGGVL
jgi:hypothetical protein